MSITRRALLGALAGLSFTAKGALGALVIERPPKPITVTPASFSKLRIEDIGDAFLLALEKYMIFKNIRYTDTFDPNWPATFGSAFILPKSCSEKSIITMQREYSTPGDIRLVKEVMERHDSKCRYYGVDIRRHPDGLAVWIAFSHDEEMPIDKDAAYSKWLVAM